MNERIKSLRKSLNMTQEQFSKKLNLTRNYIALMETGDRIPSDRTISDICREYNVSEEWLRTGEGDMFILPEDRTAAIVADLLDRKSPTYDLILHILERFQQLDPVSQEVIDNFIDDLLTNK